MESSSPMCNVPRPWKKSYQTLGCVALPVGRGRTLRVAPKMWIRGRQPTSLRAQSSIDRLCGVAMPIAHRCDRKGWARLNKRHCGGYRGAHQRNGPRHSTPRCRVAAIVGNEIVKIPKLCCQFLSSEYSALEVNLALLMS